MGEVVVCATCGTEPRQGARFCDGCGASVAPEREHAEYTHVTSAFRSGQDTATPTGLSPTVMVAITVLVGLITDTLLVP